MRVRVRLGAGLSRFADAPLLSLELAEGASVDDLLATLGAEQPALRRRSTRRCRSWPASTSSALSASAPATRSPC